MNANSEPQALRTDFQLPDACVGCGGPLAIRVTASGARGCCLRCHNTASIRLVQEDGELHVMIGGAASA